MSKDIEQDSWFSKVKWQIISFKFLAFWVSIGLLVTAWVSIVRTYQYTIDTTTTLYEKKIIDSNQFTAIITHTQDVLFNLALGHVLVLAGAILAGIIALKGVSYYTEGKNTVQALKQLDKPSVPSLRYLKKFLPPNGS